MTVISLTRGTAGTAEAPSPRLRRGRAALARIGGGLAVLVPIVFLSTFIAFCLGALSNSNPAATILGQDAATPAAVARLDKYLGLDHPLIVQYWNWLVQAVHGNLGVSYFTQIPVSQSISQRLPVDLSIAILAVILAVLIGGTAGTLAAIRRGGWFDRGVTVVCSAVSTLPAFVVGIILVVLFAVSVHAFPANGYVGPSAGTGPWLSHIFLPSLALSLQVASDIARQLRTSLVQVLDQNYITGASWSATRCATRPGRRWSRWATTSRRCWPARWRPRRCSPCPGSGSCCWRARRPGTSRWCRACCW